MLNDIRYLLGEDDSENLFKTEEFKNKIINVRHLLGEDVSEEDLKALDRLDERKEALSTLISLGYNFTKDEFDAILDDIFESVILEGATGIATIADLVQYGFTSTRSHTGKLGASAVTKSDELFEAVHTVLFEIDKREEGKRAVDKYALISYFRVGGKSYIDASGNHGKFAGLLMNIAHDSADAADFTLKLKYLTAGVTNVLTEYLKVTPRMTDFEISKALIDAHGEMIKNDVKTIWIEAIRTIFKIGTAGHGFVGTMMRILTILNDNSENIEKAIVDLKHDDGSSLRKDEKNDGTPNYIFHPESGK